MKPNLFIRAVSLLLVSCLAMDPVTVFAVGFTQTRRRASLRSAAFVSQALALEFGSVRKANGKADTACRIFALYLRETLSKPAFTATVHEVADRLDIETAGALKQLQRLADWEVLVNLSEELRRAHYPWEMKFGLQRSLIAEDGLRDIRLADISIIALHRLILKTLKNPVFKARLENKWWTKIVWPVLIDLQMVEKVMVKVSEGGVPVECYRLVRLLREALRGAEPERSLLPAADAATLPISERGSSILRKAGFDAHQFLKEGHALYNVIGGGRFLFRLRIGPTDAVPLFPFNFSEILAGLTIDIFDLDQLASQWVGRLDGIIARHGKENIRMESQSGGVVIKSNRMTSDDDLRKIYPGLHVSSLHSAEEDRTTNMGDFTYALWLEPAYRNHHHQGGHFVEIGRTVVHLAQVASRVHFGVLRTLFGVAKESIRFHEATEARRIHELEWGHLWERLTPPSINFSPIRRIAPIDRAA